RAQRNARGDHRQPGAPPAGQGPPEGAARAGASGPAVHRRRSDSSYYDPILIRNTNHVKMMPMARKHPSTRQPPDPREGLFDTLVTASFVVMAVISRIGAAHDLSLSMVRMRGILRDRRPRMTDLADYLGLEKQTMSGLVARA